MCGIGRHRRLARGSAATFIVSSSLSSQAVGVLPSTRMRTSSLRAAEDPFYGLEKDGGADGKGSGDGGLPWREASEQETNGPQRA
jgi:hypothetical protein